MNKDFIPYKEALALKELGFDNVGCYGIYYGDFTEDERNGEFGDPEGFVLEHRETQYYAQKGRKHGILAPLYQQSFSWFREKGLVGRIDIGSQEYTFRIYDENKGRSGGTLSEGIKPIGFNYNGNYEEAELACLKK